LAQSRCPVGITKRNLLLATLAAGSLPVCQRLEATLAEAYAVEVGLARTDRCSAHPALHTGPIVAGIAESGSPAQLLQGDLLLTASTLLVTVLVAKVTQAGSISQLIIGNVLVASNTDGVVLRVASIAQADVRTLPGNSSTASADVVVAFVTNSCAPTDLLERDRLTTLLALHLLAA